MDPSDLHRLTQFAPHASERDELAVGGGIYGFLGRLFTNSSQNSSRDDDTMSNASTDVPLSISTHTAETTESSPAPSGDELRLPHMSSAGSSLENSVRTPTRSGAFVLPSPSGVKGQQAIDNLVRPVPKTRTLSAVGQRLSVLFGSRTLGEAPFRLLDYDRSDFRQYWMPDARGKECYECQEKFTTFRRRHHCRICGQIFCSKCCNLEIPGRLLGYMGDLRLCNYCCKAVVQHLSAEEADQLEQSGSVPDLSDRAQSPQTGSRSNSFAMAPELSVISSGLMWPARSGSASEFDLPTPTTKQDFLFNSEQVLSVHELPTSVMVDSRPVNNPNPPSPLDEWEPEWVKSIEVDNPWFFAERRLSADTPALSTSRPKSYSTSYDLDVDIENATVGLHSKSVRFKTQPLSVPVQDVEENTLIPNNKMARSLPFMPFLPASPVTGTNIVKEKGSDSGSVTSVDSCCSATEGHGIYRLFESQAVNLLKYLLQREALDVDKWLDVVWPLVQEIAFTVQPNVRERKDLMDVLAYIHVKMLLSTRNKPSAQVIFGTVCSKSVADNRMPKCIQHPSVLVVAGAIEYERVGGKFSSIDPIILQEEDYLRNLVRRLLSTRASIVVVEKSVARLAQRFLRLAGVTLIYNMKPSALKRVARCTQADIMPSVDAQVIKPRLGMCGNFRSELVPLLNGDNKSLVIFEECQPDLCCSIVLYGADGRQLKCIKRIVRFMISVLQSAKLETELLRLSHVCVDADRHMEEGITHDCEVCYDNEEYEMHQDTQSDEHSLAHAAKKAILTLSPFVMFSLPFLEANDQEPSQLLHYFKLPLYRFDVLGERNPEPTPLPRRRQLSVCVTEDTLHPFVQSKLTHTRADTVMKSSVAQFRAQGAKLFKKRFMKTIKGEQQRRGSTKRGSVQLSPVGRKRSWVIGGAVDVLNPYHHQRLAVLFGSYSPKSPNAPLFCVRPWVVWMEFYGLHDMPLGEFLRRYCFNANYQCPSPTCDVPMLDHLRKIVHGHACVQISTQSIMEQDQGTIPQADADNQMLVWDWCGVCKTTTSARHLSHDLWHLSFAKYLEYLCNGKHLASHAGSPGQDTLCVDCVWHQHDHYFAFNNYICCFKVSHVQLYEVSFTPMLCQIHSVRVDAMTLVTDTKALAEKAGIVFTAMLEQTCLLKNHPEASKYEKTVSDLASVHEEGQEMFRQRMSDVQVTLTALSPLHKSKVSSGDEVYLKVSDDMSRCRQLLAVSVLQWNSAVTEFMQVLKQASKKAVLHGSSDLERVKSAPLLAELPVTVSVEKEKEEMNGQVVSSISAQVAKQEVSESPVLLEVPSAADLHVLKRGSCDATMHLNNNESAKHSPQPGSPISRPFTLPNLFTLSLPFPNTEHYALPAGRIPVVVRDGEIGSIISYALSSVDYEQKRRQLRDDNALEGMSMTLKLGGHESNKLPENSAVPEAKESTPNGEAAGATQHHIELQFADADAKYYCKVYFAEYFRQLRKLLLADGEDAFVRSLSRTSAWHPKGGKSGASFHRTQDGRFVFKQLSRFEMQSWLKFAPSYFDYMSTAATENKLTALAKIYGVYRIGFKNYQTDGAGKLDIFVMEYLFYNRNVSQVYDLKGSLRNRMASEKAASDLVLLDENFLKDLWNRQFYLHPHSKAALNMAISSDSHFLSAHSVMDYSLLVGVDEEKRQLVLGIVDYMRTYTLDKKLESWVKIVAVPGAHLPTVISPELYCTRFSEAIETYFSVSPDQWTGLGYGIPY